ncbi:MAG: CsgG/HfaB family protein [Planctomycetales bacterium]
MRFRPLLCGIVAGLVCLAFCVPASAQRTRDQRRGEEAKPLREIRVAVFDLDVLPGVDVPPQAVTDQVTTVFAAMEGVTLVDREQLEKVATEQKIALSGLVASDSAVKLGKFVSAQYVVVGRASRIGQTLYLVIKLIDVETTVQSTVAVKAATGMGFDGVLDRLEEPLQEEVRRLRTPPESEADQALARLREAAKPLAGKVFLVEVDERHIDRPLRDPAAQMAVVQRLRSVGIEAISPKDPVGGWKRSLLETGRYGEREIDYLIEGEGVSAFAAQLQGLTSCRARVELRIIAVPGRVVTTSDRGVGAGVDLVEALAAKSALEEAGVQAADAAIGRLVQDLPANAGRKPK